MKLDWSSARHLCVTLQSSSPKERKKASCPLLHGIMNNQKQDLFSLLTAFWNQNCHFLQVLCDLFLTFQRRRPKNTMSLSGLLTFSCQTIVEIGSHHRMNIQELLERFVHNVIPVVWVSFQPVSERVCVCKCFHWWASDLSELLCIFHDVGWERLAVSVHTLFERSRKHTEQHRKQTC